MFILTQSGGLKITLHIEKNFFHSLFISFFNLEYKDCRVEAQLLSYSSERFNGWIQKSNAVNSTSRFSMFCINEKNILKDKSPCTNIKKDIHEKHLPTSYPDEDQWRSMASDLEENKQMVENYDVHIQEEQLPTSNPDEEEVRRVGWDTNIIKKKIYLPTFDQNGNPNVFEQTGTSSRDETSSVHPKEAQENNCEENVICTQNPDLNVVCINQNMEINKVCGIPPRNPCNCEMEKACLKNFSTALFFELFTSDLRGLFDVFSLRLIVDGSGNGKMEYKNILGSGYDVANWCDTTENSPGGNGVSNESKIDGTYGTLNGDDDPNIGSSNQTQRKVKMCSFPNYITGDCQNYPCGVFQTNISKLSATEKRESGSTERGLSVAFLFASMICLLITIAIIVLTPDLRTNYSYYQLNYYVTYLSSNVFMFVSAFVASFKHVCFVSAIMLHWTVLSSLAWMTVSNGVGV